MEKLDIKVINLKKRINNEWGYKEDYKNTYI